jgi:hypothetical protein
MVFLHMDIIYQFASRTSVCVMLNIHDGVVMGLMAPPANGAPRECGARMERAVTERSDERHPNGSAKNPQPKSETQAIICSSYRIVYLNFTFIRPSGRSVPLIRKISDCGASTTVHVISWE